MEIRARTEGPLTAAPLPGRAVRQEGDRLFTLDDAQPRAALALAGAELESAQASLRQAPAAADPLSAAENNHSISRNDVDNARMQRDVAAAAVEQAKARVTHATNYAGLYAHRLAGQRAYWSQSFSCRRHGGADQRHAGGYRQLDPIRVSFALDEAAFTVKPGSMPISAR